MTQKRLPSAALWLFREPFLTKNGTFCRERPPTEHCGAEISEIKNLVFLLSYRPPGHTEHAEHSEYLNLLTKRRVCSAAWSFSRFKAKCGPVSQMCPQGPSWAVLEAPRVQKHPHWSTMAYIEIGGRGFRWYINDTGLDIHDIPVTILIINTDIDWMRTQKSKTNTMTHW